MFVSKKEIRSKKKYLQREKKFISFQRNIVWKNFLCENNLKKKYEENYVNKN